MTCYTCDMEENIIGSRIRAMRLKNNLEQEDLSKLAREHADGHSIAPETISRIEKGKNQPAAWMIRALAQALETTTDYLLGLTDDPGVPDAAHPLAAGPELEEMVRRLNTLPVTVQTKIARLVFDVLDITYIGIPEYIDSATFNRFFDSLPRDAQDRFDHLLEEAERNREEARGIVLRSNSRVPFGQRDQGRKTFDSAG